MERNELLKRLNHLIKDLTQTHNRLQESNEEQAGIEAALMSQQMIKAYNLLRKIQDSVEKGGELRSFTNIARKQTDSHKKKENLLKHTAEKILEETAKLSQTEKEKVPEKPKQETHKTEEIRKTEMPLEIERPEIKKLTSVSKKETLLHEKFSGKTESLHDKLSGSTKQNLAEKMEGKSISDLKTAIPLIQRLSFVKNIFKGDDKAYAKALDALNKCGNLAEAQLWLQEEVLTKNNIDAGNIIVAELTALLRRRYS